MEGEKKEHFKYGTSTRLSKANFCPEVQDKSISDHSRMLFEYSEYAHSLLTDADRWGIKENQHPLPSHSSLVITLYQISSV